MADATAILALAIEVAEAELRKLTKVKEGIVAVDKAAEDLGRDDLSIDTSGLDKLQAELEETVRDAKKAKEALRKIPGDTGQKIKGLAGQFGALKAAVSGFLASIVLRKIGELGKEALLASNGVARLKNQLNAIEGVAADEVLGRIADRANELGLDLLELEAGTVSFISSATRLGLTLEEATKITEGYSVAALGAGKSTAEMNRAIVQTEQALGKGKFELQDFKTILEVFPGALKAAADGLGVTNAELLDFRNNGIAAKDVALALAEALPKIFGEAVQKNAEDLEAAINRLNNQLELNKRAFGDAAREGVTVYVKSITEALERSQAFTGLLGDIAAEALEGGIGLGFVSRLIDRVKEKRIAAAEAVIEAEKAATKAALERARAEVKAAEDAEAANRKAVKALEEYNDELRDLVRVAKQAYDDQTAERERTLEEQREIEKDTTEALIEEFEKRSQAFSVEEEKREGIVSEVSEKLLDLEREVSEKRIEIIKEATVKGAEAGEEERVKILEEAQEKLLEIEEELQEKREEIAAKGLEKLIKLEEKRAEKVKKELEKIAKEEEKLAAKRKELLEESLEDVREFFKEQAKLFQGPDTGTGDALKDIEKLQDELNKIQAKTFLDPQDLVRADKLRDQIIQLRNSAGQAQESFSDLTDSLVEDSAKAADALRELVDQESFKTAFEELSAAEKQFAISAIADFEEAAASANLNQQRVQELKDEFERLGLTGPKSISSIVDALQKLEEQPTDATGKIRELAERATELGREGKVAGDSLREIADRSDEVATKAPEAATGLEGLGAAAAEAAPGMAEAGTAAESLSEPIGGLVTDLAILQESLPAFQGVLEAIFAKVAEAVETGNLAKLKEDLEGLVKASESEGPEKLQKSLEGILAVAEEEEKVKSLVDSVAKLGDEDTSSGIAKSAEAIENIAKQLTEVAKVAKDLAGDNGELQDLLKRLEDLGKEIVDTTVPALQQLVGSEGLGGIEEVLERVNTAIDDQKKKITELVDAWEQGIEKIKVRLGELSDEIDAVSQKLDELKRKADEGIGN